MKNEVNAESGSLARAIESTPRVCLRVELNSPLSAGSFLLFPFSALLVFALLISALLVFALLIFALLVSEGLAIGLVNAKSQGQGQTIAQVDAFVIDLRRVVVVAVQYLRPIIGHRVNCQRRNSLAVERRRIGIAASDRAVRERRLHLLCQAIGE